MFCYLELIASEKVGFLSKLISMLASVKLFIKMHVFCSFMYSAGEHLGSEMTSFLLSILLNRISLARKCWKRLKLIFVFGISTFITSIFVNSKMLFISLFALSKLNSSYNASRMSELKCLQFFTKLINYF